MNHENFFFLILVINLHQYTKLKLHGEKGRGKFYPGCRGKLELIRIPG